MRPDPELRKSFEEQLRKALSYLAYSHKKIQKLPDSAKLLDEESLETWESYCARFSRVADIFSMKYLRLLILEEDPGFSGSFRDYMNKAAKLNLIDDVDLWLEIRGLRNLSAHEYADDEMTAFLKQIKRYTPILLNIKDKFGL